MSLKIYGSETKKGNWLNDLITSLMRYTPDQSKVRANLINPIPTRPEQIMGGAIRGQSPGSIPMARQPEVPVGQQIGKVLGAAPQRVAVEQYQGKSTTPPPQPNQELTDLLFKYDQQDATRSAMRIAGENAAYKYNPPPNLNTNQTYDYGLGQINTTTWDDMFKKAKYKKMLSDFGIKSIDDASKSLEKGVQAYTVAKQYEQDAGADPGSWWYGWQNKGYNIDPSRPIDEVARTGNYEMLRRFLRANPNRKEVGR